MQFGHFGIALAIASIDPRPETFAVVTAAQFLPNADSLLIRVGWAAPEFHGTWNSGDRKSTRLNSSHLGISYAVFCLKKKTIQETTVYHLIRVGAIAIAFLGSVSIA